MVYTLVFMADERTNHWLQLQSDVCARQICGEATAGGLGFLM